jgi:hypothetical protein
MTKTKACIPQPTTHKSIKHFQKCTPNYHNVCQIYTLTGKLCYQFCIEKTINCQKKIATKILDHRELAKEETQQRAKV